MVRQADSFVNANLLIGENNDDESKHPGIVVHAGNSRMHKEYGYGIYNT